MCWAEVAAHAATVQGGVYDAESQNPLARTRVALVPLPGNAVPVASLLSNDHGGYVFDNVKPGWYLIRAARTGYEVAEYGQVRPGRPGVPFEVSGSVESGEARQIVMHHQAVITGSVVDDNAIGIAGWAVNLYTARQPMRRVAVTMTDDRGNFRVGELEAGSYLVRAGGGGLEDASTVVPSYYKYGTSVAGAEPVRVRLGETQGFVLIHTVEGQLFDINGYVAAPDKSQVRVSLITDTGQRLIANAAGPYTVSGVPPGPVEILVWGSGCAGFQRILVDKNLYVRVDCSAVAAPTVTGADGETLIARRVGLDGLGPEQIVSATEILLPGRWEFTVRPGPSRYLTGIRNAGDAASAVVRNDGWYVLDIGNTPRLEVTFSDKPGSISGIVSSGGRALIGAPVYLERVNPDAPELALQAWTGRADERGRYEFRGLAPGAYRLMSGYDIDPEEAVVRDRAVTAVVREGENVVQGLEALVQ